MVYGDKNNNGILAQDEILQVSDYYPFGREIQYAASLVPNPDNQYKYNGKEYQGDLGEYDYGARFYDAVIGRWNCPDPLAEEYRRRSPYNYVANNPIRNIDPDGQYEASTIITPGGIVTDHRNDDDHGVYIKLIGGGTILAGYEDPDKNYKPGDQYTYHNPTTASNYHGQYLIPASAYNYSKSVIDGKATEDWEYITNGPGGFWNTSDRYADILRRDIYTPSNQPVVEEADDVGTVLLGVVPLTVQAKQIINELNGGKNSITIKTADGQTRYDLDGAAHGGVPTPHKQIYKNRYLNGILKRITRESNKAQPLTQQEIRAIRKFLENCKNERNNFR